MPKFISNKFTTDPMSLLTQASLVVTPNGYKEGKLYSVIPSDGSGDMSVTRATTATRVNSAGLVELVPYNLVQYSEDFSNAVWTKIANAGGTIPVITTNYAAAPNGTLTADRIQLTRASGSTTYSILEQVLSCNIGSAYTYSVWLKSLSGTPSIIMAYNNDLQSYSGTTITLTNEWVRYDLTFTASIANAYPTFGIAGSSLATGNSETADFLAWGFQVNEGSLKDYQKTETRLNIPRLDYSNGTCPSLLVEPQRTNIALYSSSFDNAAWNKTQGSGGSAPIVTANYGISPDGTQNADRIQLTRTSATSSYSYVFQNYIATIGTTYTWSVWLKALSGTPSVALTFNGIDYNNIVTLTNEWERYEFTTTAGSTQLQATFLLFEALPSTSLTADFLAYGFQLELGSYATSYIPTTSASVTRNADVISKTGISSLIGQTEGTIFADFYINGFQSVYASAISLNDGVANNYIWLTIFANGNLRAEVWNGSVQASITYSGAVVGSRYKMAFGYKTNDFVLYVNGSLAGTDTTGTTFSGTTLSKIDNDLAGLAPNNVSQSTNALALWKTRLTNDQLEALTGTGFNTYAEMAEYYNYVLQ